MARIHVVKKARESKRSRTCTKCGHKIEAGERYYYWTNRIGRMSMKRFTCGEHYPRPSMLTTSDKLSQLYEIQEELDDLTANDFIKDDVTSALEDAADRAREVAEEYRESAQAVEDGFGHATYVSEDIEEKADNVDSWAEELEQAAGDIPDEPEEPELPEDADHQEDDRYGEDAQDYERELEDWRDEVKDIVSDVSSNLYL